ncbi:MAG: sodium/solute symporter [Bacteroidia bacterium]
MFKASVRIIGFICLLTTSLGVLAQEKTDTYNQWTWDTLAVMPPAPESKQQIGLAGAFSGIHNQALIIAGGANFPEGFPWEGGKKVWHDQIYVLDLTQADDPKWLVEAKWKLPLNLAYGLSIPTPQGLVCIGGSSYGNYANQVFLLKWERETQELTQSDWPDLPQGISDMTGALMGNKIYLAGGRNEKGDGKFFYVLDITSARTLEQGWRELASWPGPGRSYAMSAVQNDGTQECFFLFGGRYGRKDSISVLLSDAFRYDPKKNEWQEVSSIKHREEGLISLSAGNSLASGANHILLFGGARGKLFSIFEQIALDIDSANTLGDSLRAKDLASYRDSLQLHHPGFSQNIWAYHTITDTWAIVGRLPSGSQVTTTAHNWEESFIIASGEISPAVRTPLIRRGKAIVPQSFGWLNYSILGLYLLVLVGMGFRLSRNQHSTDDYFKGGGRIPWWAAGISIFGTQLSAITFMAIPAKTFATDWLYFFLLLSILLVAPVVIRYFLPFFRRLELTSAYEYLEKRFNLSARVLGSLMFGALQLGRLGIVLLLPSLALTVVTGIDVNICILTMGILSILYTVLGGIEAVIWTDVIQVFVLLGGAILCLFFIPYQLEGGLAGMWEVVQEYDKMKILDLRFDFSNATLWVVLIGGFFSNLVMYGSDQTVIQRFLTTKDEKSASKSIVTGALMVVPSAFIFLSIGTALFVFYKNNPAALNVATESTDVIFPWFMISQLPAGISGLLIAAIFAAAMSSLDSSMNSLATVATTDYYRRFFRVKSEKQYLNFARWTTVVTGILGTLIAIYMANAGASSLWDEFNKIVGLFAGGLGGLFMLGIFTRKANGKGAVIGLIASGMLQYWVSNYSSIHLLLFACTGALSAFILGYLASWLFREKQSTKKVLSYHSLKDDLGSID